MTIHLLKDSMDNSFARRIIRLRYANAGFDSATVGLDTKRARSFVRAYDDADFSSKETDALLHIEWYVTFIGSSISRRFTTGIAPIDEYRRSSLVMIGGKFYGKRGGRAAMTNGDNLRLFQGLRLDWVVEKNDGVTKRGSLDYSELVITQNGKMHLLT